MPPSGRERARQVLARCDDLARASDEPGCLTRPYGGPALRAAQERLRGWFAEAGMAVHRDAVGNLIARYDAASPGARRLLLGSHLDTVRDAGKYDGALGVLIALAAIQSLHERGIRLPVALEVVAFADEEGLRFQTTYLGSRALAGTLDETTLATVDATGCTIRDAIAAFGGDPSTLPSCALDPTSVIGYVEAHIEQGPVLEAMNLPVGIVGAIAGQTRIAVAFTGEAGHAGTVPMALRRDALCGAAELTLAVEAAAQARPGLVATVGQVQAWPGASNVVPGHAALTIDARHADDALREEGVAHLERRAREIAAERGLALDWRIVQTNRATACDPALTGALVRAVEAAGMPAHVMTSGAGHDAVALAPLVPVAMLFVRCAGGVSHHPAEAVALDDVAVAIEVVEHFLGSLVSEGTPDPHGTR